MKFDFRFGISHVCMCVRVCGACITRMRLICHWRRRRRRCVVRSHNEREGWLIWKQGTHINHTHTKKSETQKLWHTCVCARVCSCWWGCKATCGIRTCTAPRTAPPNWRVIFIEHNLHGIFTSSGRSVASVAAPQVPAQSKMMSFFFWCVCVCCVCGGVVRVCLGCARSKDCAGTVCRGWPGGKFEFWSL